MPGRKMKTKNLLIIGPYPPPYGGVSIHIKRLQLLLAGCFKMYSIDESRVRKENIFNIRSLNVFGYLKRMLQADIVHIHSGLLSLRLVHFIIASLFFKKKIFTIHGYEPGRGIIERTLDRIMLNNCSKTIFVSKEIADRFSIKKYIIKDAFLPPDINTEAEIPAALAAWINQKQADGFTICSANAWRLDSHNNEDMYGLDLCILAAQKIKSTGIKAAFVYVVCEDSGVIKIAPYKKMIIEYGLQDIFYLFEQPLSFVQLIVQSDIVLRPTNTDGDALTVREGLFFGKTVIASDVVVRPEGTKLFSNRNAAALAAMITTESNTVKKNKTVLNTITHAQQDYEQYYRHQIYNLPN